MTNSNKWMFITGGLISVLLIYLLAPVLTPFLIAAVLAYIGDPLVDRLEIRMPRTLAVVLVFGGLSLLILIGLIIIVPLLERQIGVFVQKLPHYLDQIQHHFLPWISQKLGLPEQSFSFDSVKKSVQEYWGSAGGLASNMLASVSRSGLVLAGLLANLLLIPVVLSIYYATGIIWLHASMNSFHVVRNPLWLDWPMSLTLYWAHFCAASYRSCCVLP